MHYDPIKKTLGSLLFKNTLTHRVFYFVLDFILLRTWHIHKALKKHARSTSKLPVEVLDAGSGLGQYTYFLARRYSQWKITAVDIKKEELEICSRFFSNIGLKNANFSMADLTSFISSGTFDLILSVDVMEHIEDDLSVFRNFFQSLKPSGVLLINTPSDKGGSDADHHSGESFIGEHVRNGYGIEEIELKLRNAGFDQISTKYTYGVPGSISWRITMKYPMICLGVSKWFLLILPVYYLLLLPLIVALNTADLLMHHQSGTGLQVTAVKGSKEAIPKGI